MGEFKIAETKTGIAEGGWANNPNDKGGETAFGIARKFWPTWGGWKYIDEIKAKYGTKASVINKYVKSNPVIMALISQFYKINFWDVLKLDQIKDQQLAETVYDFGVNSGTGRSAKYLQEAVNNLGGSLKVDGQIGNQTITQANSINPSQLHTEFNKLRRDFYNSIAKGNQKQFLNSWLSRLHPYNEMKMIQYKLGITADGIYGDKTKEAIKEFQAKHGLKVDGIPGKNTTDTFYKL
jgi:Putative secretion activating protein